MAENLYFCSLCKAKLPVESMRYSRDGKRLICVNCFNRVMKPAEPNQAKPQTKEEKKAAGYVGLICIDCRYKFAYKKGSRVALKCPYCGKGRLMKADMTAERLVQEASEEV